MLSPPPQKVQQWHDPIQCVKNNKIKISILNSISISKTQRARLAGQFKASFNQPVKGVEGPLQGITRSWRNPLGTSSSHWTASAAGPTGTEWSRWPQHEDRLPAACYKRCGALGPTSLSYKADHLTEPPGRPTTSRTCALGHGATRTNTTRLIRCSCALSRSGFAVSR